MIVKILGMGCPSCQKLGDNVRQALDELRMVVQIEKVTALSDILNYNVLSLPALVVNEKVISAGKIPSVEELKILLSQEK